MTHDQRLIEECDCELWVVENQDAKKHTAGFEDYKDVILDKIEKQAAKEEAIRNKDWRLPRRRDKQSLTSLKQRWESSRWYGQSLPKDGVFNAD